MKDCLFCKIARGEIPCFKIYEDENVLAFLDVAKDAIGHTLVIPKKHFSTVLECDEKTIAQVFDVAQKISKHFVENCGFDGVQIINNCGESAGQTIMHFHVHIVPRKKGDGLLVWKLGAPYEMDLEKIASELKLKEDY